MNTPKSPEPGSPKSQVERWNTVVPVGAPVLVSHADGTLEKLNTAGAASVIDKLPTVEVVRRSFTTNVPQRVDLRECTPIVDDMGELSLFFDEAPGTQELFSRSVDDMILSIVRDIAEKGADPSYQLWIVPQNNEAEPRPAITCAATAGDLARLLEQAVEHLRPPRSGGRKAIGTALSLEVVEDPLVRVRAVDKPDQQETVVGLVDCLVLSGAFQELANNLREYHQVQQGRDQARDAMVKRALREIFADELVDREGREVEGLECETEETLPVRCQIMHRLCDLIEGAVDLVRLHGELEQQDAEAGASTPASTSADPEDGSK